MINSVNKTNMSIMFPSSKEFIENKKISDRVYMWILLRGVYQDNGIYLYEKLSSGANELNIDIRTLKKKLQILVNEGYVNKSENDYYFIPKQEMKYKRYMPRETAEKLLNINIEHIIKVFIILCTYHERYTGSINEDFSYRILLERIGVSKDLYNSRMANNMEHMLETLVKNGLINYGISPRYNESYLGSRKFVINSVCGIR